MERTLETAWVGPEAGWDFTESPGRANCVCQVHGNEVLVLANFGGADSAKEQWPLLPVLLSG